MKQAPIAVPPSPVEGMLITFMANRRRLLWVPAIVLTAFAVAEIVVPVRYNIESQVLVALGPEYTYRAPAGEAPSVSEALDRDQTMHTEAAILGNPDLHRATLRAIGVDRLYPKIAHPGLVARTIASVQDEVAAAARWAGLSKPSDAAKPDLVEKALKTFENALATDIPKTGSVLTATFKHKDATLGAETLNTMLALYIDRRAELYRDDQSAIVARQVDIAKAAWADAEQRLASFKLSQQIGGFDAQREILLRRQGALATDRTDTQSQVAQLKSRLDDLARQLPHVKPDVAAGGETDFESRLSPTRASVEQLQAQYSRALEQYQPDAPLVVSLRAQLEARRSDLAGERRDRTATTLRTSQNPSWLALQDDKVKSQTDLAVAITRLSQDDAHLASLGDAIAKLDRSEQELGRLQLQRALAEETYRNATKTLEDRRVTDDVEARRRPTVRVLQPATPPLSAPPLHMVLAAAGVLLAGFSLVVATLLTHAFGRTYWQSETLEQDLGISVFAVFPDLAPAQAGRAA